jgi:hypothetical protein
MTSVCVGTVASQRKSGVPTRIYADLQYVSAALPSALQWLSPFLPYLPPIYFDVDAFCVGEPPAAASLVEATIAAVLAGGEAGAALVAAQLVWGVIQQQLWYQWCECSSGTQPTPPAGQSAPTNLPAVNPPAQLPPSPTIACYDATEGPNNFIPNQSLTIPLGSVLVGRHATTVRFTVTTSVVVATGPAITFHFVQLDANNATISDTAFSVNNHTTTEVHVIPIAFNTVNCRLDTSANATAGTTARTVRVEFFCNGDPPGGTVTPCCPPDPNLTGMMTQILQYVTLLQRHLVPFAYVSGAVHSALSGAGTISIQGLLGAQVHCTTIPTSYGRAGTSPTEYFDMGFVTFGTADGWPTSFRLERADQLMFPRSCSLYTDLDYDLAPGLVVTITEIKREA